jgi:hypothetical protein
MTAVWKYVLLAVLTAAALNYLQAAARTAAVNLHRLRSWKRIPGTVSRAERASITVRVGSGPEETFLKIPRTFDDGYWVESKVTVIQNPEDPEERRLTGFRDLWNPPLVAAIFGLALLTAAWLVWSTTWGADAVWSGGAWRSMPVAVETVPEFEVSEPGESWKANLFYGCVMGLSFGLPPFFTSGPWTPWRAMWAVVGIGFFLWMVQSAAFNYSRTVRLSGAGLEERTVFGTRRISLEELGGLEFRDVGRQLENLRPWQVRRLTGVRPIDVWTVMDRERRAVFTLPGGMTPDATFRAMRGQLERRTPAR